MVYLDMLTYEHNAFQSSCFVSQPSTFTRELLQEVKQLALYSTPLGRKQTLNPDWVKEVYTTTHL